MSNGEPHADGAARCPPIREFGFRPQGTEERLRAFLSAIWRRRQGIRAASFGTGHGLNLRRDGTAGRPQASTRRPGRSLMSVPLGWTDRGLKDGAGLFSRERSIRMASEERALAVRSGAHPGSDAGAAGRLVRGSGRMNRRVLGAASLARGRLAPRRRSKLAVAGCQVRACREDRLGKAPPLFRAGALAGSGGVSQRPASRGVARGVP
jgi:hypothetical protein